MPRAERVRPERPERPKHARREGPVRPVEPQLVQGPPRSGWVALVGRPNVGKSTLLNALLGQKLAATTHKPQTTRKNLLGVLNPPGAQILLLDTPGHHQAQGALNRFMVAQAEQAVEDADVIAYLVTARSDKRITPGNETLLQRIKASGKKVVLLLNKLDEIKERRNLVYQIAAFQEVLGEQLAAVVPISAKKGIGLEAAVKEIAAALPEGERLYAEDVLTTEPERNIVAEFIREKVMLVTHQELPYAVAVTIDSFEDIRPRLVRISATLHVERDTQKPIIIGEGGERLKEIGSRARQDIEYFLDTPVYLELFVRVTSDWSASKRGLQEVGLDGAPGAADWEDTDESELAEVDPDLLPESAVFGDEDEDGLVADEPTDDEAEEPIAADEDLTEHDGWDEEDA